MGVAGSRPMVSAWSIMRSTGWPTAMLTMRSGLNAFTCRSCGVRSVAAWSNVIFCSSMPGFCRASCFSVSSVMPMPKSVVSATRETRFTPCFLKKSRKASTLSASIAWVRKA